MRPFRFTEQHEDENLSVIESAIRNRRRKIAKQQLIYTIILLLICIVICIWLYRKIVYIELDGYVSTDVTTIRPGEDVYFLESKVDIGEIVVPGDTLYSFALAHHFYNQEEASLPSALLRSDDLRTNYALARQDLEVLRVRIAELERQLAVEDHNTRFGLSDNHNKLRTEQALAEAREQYNAQRRKLGVLWNAIAAAQKYSGVMGNRDYWNLSLMERHDLEQISKLGLMRYAIATDSAIVTNKLVAAFSLVLRGEPLMTYQSLNLKDNNLNVVAYVMPDEMKYVNYNSTAIIKVNDEIAYTGSVVMVGARTEEIPGELRNTLSRQTKASIVVFDIDPNQDIPYWSLSDGVPVKLRINKFWDRKPQSDDYIIYNTTTGVNDTVIEMRRRKHYAEKHGVPVSTVFIPASDSTAVAATAQPADTATTATAAPTAPAQPKPAAAAQHPCFVSDSSGNLHIVVESGYNSDGADRSAARLRAKGYKDARVITIDGRYRVAIGSFSRIARADSALNALKKFPEFQQAWIIKE